MTQVVSYWLRTQNAYDLELDKLSPGEDAIEYFLGTSKKGYCVHFASAGTLVLRELGVPARYVTGFMVKPDAVTYEDGTYKASVLDSNAHAWVEIYMENYGWIPVEMTPGYGEAGSGERVTTVVPPVPENTPEPEEEDEPEVTQEPATDEPKATTKPSPQSEVEQNREESSDDSADGKGGNGSGTDTEDGEKKGAGKFVAGSMLIVLVGLAGVGLYRYHADYRKRKNRQLNAYMLRGENQKAVKWINQAIYKALVDIDRKYAKLRDAEYLAALKQEFEEAEEAQWDVYFDIVRRTVYSREQISAEEVKKCYALYRLVQQNSKKNRKNS